MTTECSETCFPFHSLNQREVRGNFDGGTITSDGGGLLLREVEKKTKIIEQFAACFTDFRNPELVEHTVAELVGQRVYGLALGYEDLNDHDELRRDPLLAVLVEKEDLTGENRRHAADRGAALAGKSTLNRMELGGAKLGEKERYRKIILNDAAVDRLLVDMFLQAHGEAPPEIVLDLDSTDIPLHGEQEERFFHGYYGHYCYLPLYIVCGEYVLCARLRPSNIDGAKGTVSEVERIVGQIRGRWPQVRIILRGDSGFCREELLTWCEQHEVDYVFGIAQNAVLLRTITAAAAEAAAQYEQTGKAARVFTAFEYRTKESWSRARRVIAKAEHLERGPNPRFVVTSLSGQEAVFPAPSRWAPRSLYEEFYCARGDMGVSRQGHINQSVKVRSRPRDSSLVAGEAPWRESKTVKPSDNMLRKEHAQLTRLQRAVNADVASLPANPGAETVHNVRKQQGLTEASLIRQHSPAGYQRRHGEKADVSTGETLGARRRKLVEEVSTITVSGKGRHRHQGDGSGRSTVDGRAAKRARREGPGPVSTPLVKVRQG